VARRKPCPKCGSTARNYDQKKHRGFSMQVDAVVVTYPQRLLGLAKKLMGDGEFGIAIVVAHMACEIATERAMSDAFAAKGVSYLEDPVTEFLNGYSLANSRIRKLYTALTGDEVEKASFRQGFKASAVRRNKIVHSSVVAVTKTEADESYLAASALVAHLKK
jgi:hypothetical protein